MKNLFAFFVVILLSGYTFAQNTAVTIQTGPNNSAVVDQSGSLNDSKILQESSVFPPNGMTADVDQVGTGNKSDVYQGQFGQHFATVNQNGIKNDAQVISLRNNGTAYVLQDGSENKAYQRLHGNLSETVIEQIGNRNNASQDIGVYGTAGVNNKFELLQSGNDNKSTQQLLTDYDFVSANNYGIVTQKFGNGNIANQSIGTVSSHSSGNNASIIQQGSLNKADQLIEGSLNNIQTVVVGSENIISQTAVGDRNYSYLTALFSVQLNDMKSIQTGDNNFVNSRIQERSNENLVDVLQNGTGNKSYNIVSGDDNKLYVVQDGASNTSGSGNVAGSWGIVQSGNGNEAGLYQYGDLNTGTIYQAGDGNIGSITSNGNGHFGSISQTGGMNQAVITQNP